MGRPEQTSRRPASRPPARPCREHPGTCPRQGAADDSLSDEPSFFSSARADDVDAGVSGQLVDQVQQDVKPLDLRSARSASVELVERTIPARPRRREHRLVRETAGRSLGQLRRGIDPVPQLVGFDRETAVPRPISCCRSGQQCRLPAPQRPSTTLRSHGRRRPRRGPQLRPVEPALPETVVGQRSRPVENRRRRL